MLVYSTMQYINMLVDPWLIPITLLLVAADWLELPGAIILIIVVAPNLFAYTIRGDWLGAAICLVIGCYLLQEHIRASGGFRNSFTRANGVSNSVGIILLLIYPVWFLITDFIQKSKLLLLIRGGLYICWLRLRIVHGVLYIIPSHRICNCIHNFCAQHAFICVDRTHQINMWILKNVMFHEIKSHRFLV